MDVLPKRSSITDVLRTTVANTETTRAYSENTALIANTKENFINQETVTLTNSRTISNNNNPFLSNFERSFLNHKG
jgi:hypothetical protein